MQAIIGHAPWSAYMCHKLTMTRTGLPGIISCQMHSLIAQNICLTPYRAPGLFRHHKNAIGMNEMQTHTH